MASESITGQGGPSILSADQLKSMLQTCEDEPIRVPGSIQRHGFLLVVDASDRTIVAASENAEEFLDVPLKLILGTGIETILERELLSAIRGNADVEHSSMVMYLGAFVIRGELCTVVSHRVDGQRILEFERVDRLVSPELMNAVFTNFVGNLARLGSERELCQAITRQVKDLTGFNRVMLYSFDEAGHGTVLTEENDGVLPSYLGLRFPASDIPKQARELYVLNTVRIIPDAMYTPSPLRGIPGKPVASLDLSLSVLRSVSPLHVEYMRNMGTMSSMSVSIVSEGKLWGLISAHNAEPRTAPYLVRSACDLLTKLVGNQLTAFRTSASLGKMVHFHAVQRSMLTEMAAENNYIEAMVAQRDDLIRVTDAAGVALVLDGRCECAGHTPDEPALLRLMEWMDGLPETECLVTNTLSKEIPWAGEFAAVASGLLAIRISDVKQSYVMWFRPEVLQTVNWAGFPAKTQDEANRLSPRTSFASWQEVFRGQSERWSEMEIASARDFRAAVTTIGLKRAEEAVQIGEARFKQLTYALPNLVWTADDDGKLTYVNERWQEQGLGSEGRWFERARVAEEDRRRCEESWKKAVEDGAVFEEEVRFLGGAEDPERWNLVRATPFLRADGGRVGWVGVCTDLTDRREREIALRMTEKLALTGRMTSVIAHEINNPLESITNLLYLLRQEMTQNTSAETYISLAESELERISGITKQTLRWSRENGQRPEVGTAGAIFDDVLRLFAGKIRNREVTVRVEGSREVAIYGVLGQVRQVIANLVSNAVDAVPVGGHVRLNAVAMGDSTEITVADTGKGMSQETLQHLFKPFYSTKGDRGNGLGLYISYEIVEQHGGRLHVESGLGEGTTIRVILPNQGSLPA